MKSIDPTKDPINDPMKKNRLLIPSLLLAALLLMAFFSCSGGGKAAGSDSDSMAAISVDSLFSTPDLAYSELHGPVESCELSSVSEAPEGMSMTMTSTTFDTEGRMRSLKSVIRGLDGEIPIDDMRLSYDAEGNLVEALNEMADGPEKLDIERSADGEMTRVAVLNRNSLQAYTTYHEWEAGRCVSERYTDANGVRVVRNYYDDNGLLTGRKVTYQTEEGDLTESYKFEYTNFDSVGNWTERRGEVTITENYNDSDADGEAPASVHGPFTLTETRSISYF